MESTNEMSEEVMLPVPEENLNDAPSGYDAKAPFGGQSLNPAPPNIMTLSKKIGMGGALVLFAVLMMIMYGVYSRGKHNQSGRAAKADDKSIVAATNSGKDIQHTVEEQRLNSLRNGGTHPTLPIDVDDTGSPSIAAGKQESIAPPLGVVSIKPGVPRLPERSNGIGGGGVPPQTTAIQGSAFRGRTAEEKQREEMYKLEQAAMMASTGASTGGAKGGASGIGSLLDRASSVGSNPLTGLISQLHSSVAAAGLGAQAGVAGGPPPMKADDDPNMQDRKDAFLAKAEGRALKNYLLATRTKPLTQYEVKTGWDIPAVLEQRVNSDLPGQIKALVRENVYDTATGQYLLIPQGSRVVGSYDSHIAYGQTRVQIIWSQLIFPDGTTMNLEGMIGQDAAGASGFHDKTNNHYVRLFGMALMTSAFSAGIQISQGNSGTTTAYPSSSQLATQALGQQMGQLGMEIARKNMNVQPTITVPIGYRFNIRVNRDIAFGEPYTSMAR